MLIGLKIRLSQYGWYWKAVALKSKFIFIIRRDIGYRSKELFKEVSEENSALSNLFRATLSLFLLPVLIALSLHITEPMFSSLFKKWGMSISEHSDYATLLAAITSVGGLFIGLYYAAITTISSAIYARVPNNIRNLLAQERLGNTYMRYLASYTFLGLLLLSLYVAGYKPNILTLPIFMLGAGFAIFSFIRLGSRAFGLFDPTSFAGHLFYQIKINCEKVVAGGLNWEAPEFQKHAYRSSKISLDTLLTLADISEKEPHLNGRVYTDLCYSIVGFLFWYEPTRKRIPTNSNWFEQRYQHPEWYLTNDTEVTLRYQTATILEPKLVRNYTWLEDELFSVILRCLSTNIESRQYSLAIETIKMITRYVILCGEHSRATYAFGLINKTSTIVEKSLDKEESKSDFMLEQMAIYDAVAFLPIALLQAFVKRFDENNISAVKKRLTKLSWKSHVSFYELKLSEKALDTLEWLQPRLAFEKRVEKSKITPNWYIYGQVCKAEAEQFKDSLTSLLRGAESLYSNSVEKNIKDRQHWLAATSISREREFWTKYSYWEHIIEEQWRDFILEKRVDGEYFPSLDFQAFDDLKNERAEGLATAMAEVSLALLYQERSEQYPDFSGQFLHALGEDAFQSIIKGNLTAFSRIYPSFWVGCFKQFEKIRPKDEDEDEEKYKINKLKISLAPLMDLMELTGYAILMASYHDEVKFNSEALKMWDNYFDDDSKRVGFIISAIQLIDSSFEIAHRDTQRFNWKQAIEQMLSSIKTDDIHHDWNMVPEKIVLHECPLVRLLRTQRGISFYNGIDIFITKYMLTRKDALDVKFSNYRRDFRDEVTHEIKRYSDWKAKHETI